MSEHSNGHSAISASIGSSLEGFLKLYPHIAKEEMRAAQAATIIALSKVRPRKTQLTKDGRDQ